MRGPRFPFALTALLAVASSLSGQVLRLDVRGGSVPGTLQADAHTGPIGRACAIFPSISPGPTSMALIDPRDNRILSIGVESLGFGFPGVFLPPDNHHRSPTIAIPNNPGFLGATIYWQAIDLPGVNRLVNRISNPAATRFARANAFADRRTMLAAARAFTTVITMGDDHRWMIAGGGNGGLLGQIALDTTEIYDPLTDAWTRGPLLTTQRSVHTATRLKDGRWMLIGGVDIKNDPQETTEYYDAKNNRFVALAKMTAKRMGHSATVLPDGRVFVAGGLSAPPQPGNPLTMINSALITTEIYDPVRNTWTAGPNMNVPRAGHAALVLPNGKIVLAAGIGWRQIIIKIPWIFTDCDIYDPATNRITAGPKMATPRAIFSCAPVGSGYLASGGISGVSLSSPGFPTDTAEIYDFASSSWKSAGKMKTARGIHYAFGIPGKKVLHIGGANNNLLSPNALASTEIYDIATGTWSAGPQMTRSRAGYGYFETPMGQIHLVGGGSGVGSFSVNTTEWFYR